MSIPLGPRNSTYDDDDDYNDESFGRQILPIANLPQNFNGTPEDGMQYLFLVRRDARSLPLVTRVPNPYAVAEQAQQPEQPKVAHPKKTLGKFLPSDEWRCICEKRFRNMQANLKQPTIHVQQRDSGPNRIPPTLDRALWWAFLHCKPEMEWNPPKQSKRQQRRMMAQDGDTRPLKRVKLEENNPELEDGEVNEQPPEECLPTPAPSTRDSPVTSLEPKLHVEPTLSMLVQLASRQPLQLLRSFTYWINHRHPTSVEPDSTCYPVAEFHSRWIWSLLGIIDSQLIGDDVHLLRELARACLDLIRERLQLGQSSAKELGSWWLCVVVIVGVWGQRDLWEDAEKIVQAVEGC